MSSLSHRGIVGAQHARRIIRQAVQLVGREQTGVINTLGRTLAEDLKAGANIPVHDTASCNGYAALSSDTTGATEKAPRCLSVLSESPRGKKIEPGTVVRMRGGDPLPEGADTVVGADKTYRPEDGPQVLVMAESKPRENITPAGTLVSADEVVLREGVKVDPGTMGLIASLGKPGVAVSRKPKVAIVTTGARVMDILDKLEPGETRNSARYALVGMLIESGCDLGRLIHMREGRLGLEKIIKSYTGCDAMIVALDSQDKHDMALQALAHTGEVHFERVLMEPGTNSAFGMVEEKPVFITESGTSLEAFEALIRPGLLTMLGRSEVERPMHPATLGATLKINPSTCHYIKATTRVENGALVAKPMAAHSPDTRPWMIPNSLIFIPENIDTAKRGESVDVLLLAG